MTGTLNGRSHFSLGESLLTPTEIVNSAALQGHSYVTLTDTMRISGMAEFFTAAKSAGIKPIIGARLRIVDELTHDKASKKGNKPYYLRVLIRTDAGYRALLKLLSLAFDDEHFYEVPRLTLADVAEVMGEVGEIASIVTLGDFYGAHAAGKAREVVTTLRAANVHVVSEILPIPTAYFVRMAHDAYALRESHRVPVTVSELGLYERSEDANSLDLMGAVVRPGGMKFDERSARNAWQNFVPQDKLAQDCAMNELANNLAARYGFDADEYAADLQGARGNCDAFADSVTFSWEKEQPSLPKMAEDEFATLKTMCVAGWKKRFSRPVYGYTPTDMQPYKDRLVYELGVLKKLKFESYFLLVSELVNWSKSQGIIIGPGRGSVGGSLVAYLLGITDIDPIRFDLLFERFINPDRIDLPDADLDFQSSRRDESVAWLTTRFGADKVAGVTNFVKIAGAGSLQVVSSKLGVEDIPAFGGWIAKEHGVPMPLADAISASPQLEAFALAHPEVLEHALKLEGKMKTYSQHPSGMIVAGVPISERAVVETRNGTAIINWDKRIAEDFGLVKLDVLGLSTLDMMAITLKHIFQHHGVKLDLQDVPLDDVEVLEEFGKGHTVGVFQFDGGGMRRLLRDLAKIKTLTFEDITAATALYRPGPMDSGIMQQFIEIKQGKRSVTYDHPSMKDALKNTYGVMVYQEQVMRVSQDFAGFSLVEADHLRKVMGKKDKIKMKTYREKFVQGAVATSKVNESFAGEIFDKIEKFAGYGFNKSHASAYALISYLCMWLKVKYPAEFFCGTLTEFKVEKRPQVLVDMQRHGIKLVPPDINESGLSFEPLHSGTIIAPFSSLLGISDNTANAILAARASGKFKSKADFIERVERRKCNSRHQDILDRVGAFARIESGTEEAGHHSRRKDQMELMEGLISEYVLIDRPLTFDDTKVRELVQHIADYKVCGKCELEGLCHPKPWVHGKAKVVIVVDGPSFKEEGADEMGHGNTMDYIDIALDRAGYDKNDVYVTGLIKSPKPEGEKTWSNTTLSACPTWLDKELEILKSPLIIVLGSLAAKHFVPGIKGGLTEHYGRVIYDKDRDANILLGINPGTIYFSPEKQLLLDEVIAKIPELLTE